ncbi:MAG: hypothetical protein ABR974_06860 [Bacteroidales bacterium]|jgi:hypothetical protein
MEAETNPEPGRRRWWICIIVALFALFTLYYSVMAIISSSRKISALNLEYGYKPAENTTTDNRIFSDSAFVSLNREKAYFQARNIMAETDSISLSLNLSDSTALLEINGVTVHKAKLLKIDISKVFSRADEYAVSAMLSVPFTVKENYGTIKKEPLMLKIAPKDTSEYKPDILPDTTNSSAVNYMMETENGFRLYVYQEEDAGGALSRFVFDAGDRFKNIWDIIKSIALFKVPEYHPAIRLRMKKVDARIIYRALPAHGQISLFR